MFDKHLRRLNFFSGIGEKKIWKKRKKKTCHKHVVWNVKSQLER